MPTLEEALNQLTYWKDVVERERKQHAKQVTELHDHISMLTKELLAVRESEGVWKAKFERVSAPRSENEQQQH